jgi:hypothetical protein
MICLMYVSGSVKSDDGPALRLVDYREEEQHALVID